MTLSSKRLGVLLLAFCVAILSMGIPSQAAYQERPAALADTIINSNITADTTWTLAG